MAATPNYGDYLKSALGGAGWTHRRLALALGISPSTVTQWTQGTVPRPETQRRIIELLDAPCFVCGHSHADIDTRGQNS